MMVTENLIFRHFNKPRVLLPVIHPIHKSMALKSIQTAIDGGADGVFLINQGMNEVQVLDFLPEVASTFPGLWLGVNLLGSRPESALKKIRNLPVRGLWADNAGIDETSANQRVAERFRQARGDWEGLYFGGVAFKYQRSVATVDLPQAARAAIPYVDVITTSGPGTGLAADVTRIKTLRRGAEGHAIGLASGVTPENVASFLPFVNAFLVATGIESSLGVLDLERTRRLAQAIHALPASKGAVRALRLTQPPPQASPHGQGADSDGNLRHCLIFLAFIFPGLHFNRIHAGLPWRPSRMQ